MNRILLLGYFGAGNFGDDALLAGWLLRNTAWLADNGLVADITVGGDQPPCGGFLESDALAGIAGSLIPKQQALSLPLDTYRALIAPGGSLLQDATSLKSLLYYLGVIRRFTRAGKPVYLLSQGLGPFKSLLARFLAPRYLRRVRLLSIRDADGFSWATENQLLHNHPDLLLGCDPILDPPFRTDSLARLNPLLQQDYVLLIPRPTGDLPYPCDETTEPEALAALAGHVHRTTGLQPLLLPLHGGQDRAFCEDTQVADESCILVDPVQLGEHRNTNILSVIAGAKMVISYRLHGLVCAAAYGIPALGVAYDPKVSSFCYEVGLPHCFPATVHHEMTLGDIDRLWQDRSAVTDNLAACRERLLERNKTVEERFHELW